MSDAEYRQLRETYLATRDPADRWAVRRLCEHNGLSRPFPWKDDESTNYEGDDYDWRNVFAYAEPKRCEAHAEIHGQPGAFDSAGVACDPFTRADVERVVASSPGNNNGPDWLIVGWLFDGRCFFLRAGCDYTGWG